MIYPNNRILSTIFKNVNTERLCSMNKAGYEIVHKLRFHHVKKRRKKKEERKEGTQRDRGRDRERMPTHPFHLG